MNKYSSLIFGLLMILLITIGILNLVAVHKISKDRENLNVLEVKIDSLNQKKDSIRSIILTKDNEIVTNEQHYKETVNTIYIQPSNADSIFARDYIQKFIDQRVR